LHCQIKRHANYKVEIVEASPTTFKARATAVVDFDQDGQINVWEIDHSKALKEITKD
jgi:type IV pilus assembly protein PilE